MISLVRRGGSLLLTVLALGLGVWFLSGPSALADEGGYVVRRQKSHQDGTRYRAPRMSASGTLGYGAPGLYPGFQGFGLGYHRGYGYGGDALGVGAEGGYPFYGGPGYPHPWPCLRRCGRINPFPYYGGPGFPSADCPHYFGAVGPLVADQPVITIGSDFDQSGGYGMFTGVLPYSEAYLAPYTTSAAAEDSPNESSSSYPSTPSTNPAPALREVPPSTTTGRSLGIEAEPVVEAGGVAGLKVTKVYPESVAEKAGLHAGDVIHSINGYLTQQPGNLAWIIAHAAPDNVLMMNVHTTSAAREQTLRAQLP